MSKGKKYFDVRCVDGAQGILSLKDKSVKIIYGSPPYPNADRNYGKWSSAEYIAKMTPFLDAAKLKLRDDGFLVINIKANREKGPSNTSTRRSLIVEKLAILLEERWGFYCVDIEIWIKDNPVPTGLRVACQDAYEQNLWFSVSPKWKINLDAIRRPYDIESIKAYAKNEYKPRANGLSYVRKNKRIEPNPLGALPLNVIKGSVSGKQVEHQAVQPGYLAEKYIKATTSKGDIVVDPWLGSGTTGREAVKLGRYFIGFDIDKDYVSFAASTLTQIAEELKMKAAVNKDREEIHKRFVDCLGDAVVSHSDMAQRPLTVDLCKPLNLKIRVYLFQSTNPPGGRPTGEYKFNLSVPAQEGKQKGNFDESDDRIVFLVSYVPDFDVFIMYDAYRHKDFSLNANVQCKSDLILNALQHQVVSTKRRNGEPIIASKAINLIHAIKERIKLLSE